MKYPFPENRGDSFCGRLFCRMKQMIWEIVESVALFFDGIGAVRILWEESFPR